MKLNESYPLDYLFEAGIMYSSSDQASTPLKIIKNYSLVSKKTQISLSNPLKNNWKTQKA